MSKVMGGFIVILVFGFPLWWWMGKTIWRNWKEGLYEAPPRKKKPEIYDYVSEEFYGCGFMVDDKFLKGDGDKNK